MTILAYTIAVLTVVGMGGAFLVSINRFMRRLDELLSLPDAVKNLTARLSRLESAIDANTEATRDQRA
jgi:hypothetical protein